MLNLNTIYNKLSIQNEKLIKTLNFIFILIVLAISLCFSSLQLLLF